MSEPIRKTILIELDVVVSEDNDDYLEVEITHARLSGALYLTVSSHKELNQELDKVDLTGIEAEEIPKVYTSTSNPVITPSASFTTLIAQTQKSGRPLEDLIRNSFNLANGVVDLTSKLRKK